ncbi:TadE/TadG family type IV pilus assembly protein [Sphingobium sp. YBL2]|uniref:TadE/TadG family type IV pilus assembly protein n=1 Tax=Sphingobium sp. (strain YBL2) TaxID=484429 RepID=UPI0005DA4A67|nr:TadE/TadG family type IV pilus assembly protein [Sphingobium sp. YBL2]AJR27061.1 hypothetical protein TZ53_24655 [Sphingobium sp. YBL2]
MAALEFVLIAPALLLLIFAVVFYSFYFSAFLAVRQVASDSARAAVAGLSIEEREDLARNRAKIIIDAYGNLLSGIDPNAGVTPVANTDDGTLSVTVEYDFAKNPIYRYGGILPIPDDTVIKGRSVVPNGSY